MEPVTLQPWSVDDLGALQRSNTPEMMAFLGGPETEEKLAQRHAKYLRFWESGEARMFTVRTPSETQAVGSIGYWKCRWHDTEAYETGWSIASAYQGRGLAGRAVRACLLHAAEHGDRSTVLAYPRTDNLASNALCRSAGFTLFGEEATEYPPGNPIVANAWVFDLGAIRGQLQRRPAGR